MMLVSAGRYNKKRKRNYLRREIDEVNGSVELVIELLRVVQLEPILHALCGECECAVKSEQEGGKH